MRQWFESVLEHGFAYGSKGKALEGKKFIVSFTTGSATSDYKEGGAQNYTLEDLTKGFHQLANLCSMKYEGFIHTGGAMFFMIKDKPDEVKKLSEALGKPAEKVCEKAKK